MQNEPKFQKSQVNVSDLIIREYEQMDTWSIRKNEPKRTQNEPKVKMGKMNVTTCLTMNYKQRTMNDEKNEPKTNPINTPPKNQIYPVSYQRTANNEQRTNNKQTQFQNRILFDDCPFILYTGVLYKKKPNMDKQ